MKSPAKPKLTPNPIADIFAVLDIGAEEINLIMEAARTFPMLHAYESPDGRFIAIATREPSKTHFAQFTES
jgi:hypothetical protein